MVKRSYKGFKTYSWGLVPFIIGLSIVGVVLVYSTFNILLKENEINIDYLYMWILFLFILILTLYIWYDLRDKAKYHFLTVNNVSTERLFKSLSKCLSSHGFKEMEKSSSELPFKNVIQYYYSSKMNLEVLVQKIQYKNIFLQSKTNFKVNIGPMNKEKKKMVNKIKKEMEKELSKHIIRQELL
ncbi:MAG: hypothetical protein ACOC53_01310 [Candidatus Saliniplasma sp.]